MHAFEGYKTRTSCFSRPQQQQAPRRKPALLGRGRGAGGGARDHGWLRGTFERAHCGWLGRLVGVVGSVGVAGSGTQPTGGEEEGKEDGGLGKQELGMLAVW